MSLKESVPFDRRKAEAERILSTSALSALSAPNTSEGKAQKTNYFGVPPIKDKPKLAEDIHPGPDKNIPTRCNGAPACDSGQYCLMVASVPGRRRLGRQDADHVNKSTLVYGNWAAWKGLASTQKKAFTGRTPFHNSSTAKGRHTGSTAHTACHPISTPVGLSSLL